MFPLSRLADMRPLRAPSRTTIRGKMGDATSHVVSPILIFRAALPAMLTGLAGTIIGIIAILRK
jgi:hypothetical protein